jgi:RNA polymerase sigma factor (sigma-70 family)
MTRDESVTTLLAGLKAGRKNAAADLWQRYVENLVRLASRKMGRKRYRAVDEEDVVLSAFDAFLKGVNEGRFAQLDGRDDLWQILVMLTERKVIAVRRREGALKRGGGHVRGESALAQVDGNGSHGPGLDQVVGSQPTPAMATELAEQARSLLSCLSDDVQRKIALGKLEGYTNQELAKRLDINLRAVERKLRIIRRKWKSVSA